MQIESGLSDEAVLGELGARLTKRRLDLQLTQADLAEKAGVSKRTVERIEAGGAAQTSSMLRVLRALDLLEGLEGLLGETGPSPMELLKLKGSNRKRVGARRKEPPRKNWAWGDET